MSFRNCIINEEYKKLEATLLDRDAELPEKIVKIKYKYRSVYLFEVIKYEAIIDLIKLNCGKTNQTFFIVPWGDDGVFEFKIDENINSDYIRFMYEPELLNGITPPRSAFGVLHENIHIFNEEKSIVIVADRYYDVLYFYSNNPIKNIENLVIDYTG